MYIKDIFGEHWDDYQLNSMTKGGNKNLFKVMKEYGLQYEALSSIYNEPCIIWYRNMHQAKLDEMPFSDPKPGKDLREHL